MAIQHRNTIRDSLLRIFSPKDRRPIHEWAHDNLRELPPVLTVRGAFSVEHSRHFIAPLEALADEHVRQVAVRKPVRGGGTLISDVWHVWCRSVEPGPAMAIFQSDKIAEDHGASRLLWMMKHCEATQNLFSSDRYSTTKDCIRFADGVPFYITGPGINNLQTRGLRYLSVSESWIPAVAKILEQAEARLMDFMRTQSSKIYFDSQGSLENDPFDERWCQGDQNIWQVQCAGCGKYCEPRFSGLRPDGTRWGLLWDKSENISRILETIRFECQHCGHVHTDSPRTKSNWNLSGKYVPQNPNAARSKKSHTWNAVIFDPWANLVEKYLGAIRLMRLGNAIPIIEFVQKYCAESTSEASVQERISNRLPTASYEVKSDWPAEYIRFMTVDVQEDCFWVVVRAWSRTGESRRLFFGQKFGWADLEKLQEAWKVNDSQVVIDSGYRTREVYGQCCKHGAWGRLGGQAVWIGWHPVRGTDELYFNHKTKNHGTLQRSYAPPTVVDAEAGTEASGANSCQLFRWSNQRIKERMMQLLKKGLMLSPPADPHDKMEREYKRQMAGEYLKAIKSKLTGKTVFKFVKCGDNHAYDCEAMSVLAATMGYILPDSVEDLAGEQQTVEAE